MALLDRLRGPSKAAQAAQALAFEEGFARAIAAIPYHSRTDRFGTGLGNQPNTKTLLRESKGVADTATRAIANRLSMLNPQVMVSRRDRKGTVIDEIIDDNPLKMLLDRPHPNYSRAQMLRLVGQYVVTCGEAYWQKVGSGLGIPVELHPVPPWLMEPIIEQNIIVAYWVTDGDGGQRAVDANEFIRFFYADPEDPWNAEGYLAPSAVTADSLKFAGQTMREHYMNNATPKTALEAGEQAQPFTKDEKESFLTRWRKRYNNRVGTSDGLPVILPTHYKLIQMAMESGADITPLLEYWSNMQLMDFGVPKSILGMVVSGDRSSAETNQYVFDRHTILPISTMIEDALTLQLAPDFDPALFVKFEKFVSDDKAFELAQETADITNKVRSPNMILEARGEDPVPWGDRPPAKVGETWYEPEIEDELLPADDPGAISDPEVDDDEVDLELDKDDDGDRMRAAESYFSKARAWERQVNAERTFVPAFTREMRKIFLLQKNETLKKLEATKPRSRVTADEIFDDEAWDKIFNARVEPIRRSATNAAGSEAIAGISDDLEFIFNTKVTAQLRKQAGALITNANRTTQKAIARELATGNSAGEGVGQLATRIRRVFDVRRQQARTIARTEVLKATQTGQLAGFEQSGVARKQWNTSLDADVRDSHLIDGQVVDLDESFTLTDGERADAPGIGEGGSSLSASNSINCRCFVTPVEEKK